MGRTLPTTLQFTQNRDSVEGNFSLGQITAAVQGVVNLSGGLSMSDATVQNGDFRNTLSMISLNIDGNDRIQGNFRAGWTHSRISGSATFDGRMRIVVRTSAIAAPAAVRQFAASSWQELVAALSVK